ncbi:MAG: ATP-dependent DNA helicase RecQ [Bacteroides sp.]
MTYHQILKQYWGYDEFRGIQEDIIQSISQGKDTLGLMPTGGGKSITFQIPALAQEGLCIVVTPLIALMKDQVQNLRQRGIKAVAIYSGMSRQEIIIALENCIFGDYKFLYVSPERLDTDIFKVKLRAMKVSMITIDESHCISQWGYDFRPSYLKIADIRQLLPNVPVLALTATATPEVVEDIQERLLFRKKNVFKMSFERKNLAYIVRKADKKEEELLHILNRMSGSAIVYARSRKETKELTKLLHHNNITAEYYHAGLSNEAKDDRQKKWQMGEARVMVATNAFGMGIDKADVRLVIHMGMPDSPEAYFQEAGRAGRDGDKAYAVMLYTNTDKSNVSRRIASTFPEKEYIKDVYEHLNYYYQMAMGDGQGCTFEFNLEEFCYKFKYFPVPADSALKILTQAGYIEYTDEQDNPSRLIFTVQRDELYRVREQNKETEALLLAILRSYTGVFTDYVYIREDALAQMTGLTREQIYELLISLSHRHILDYIPRKKTPFVVYTRERIDVGHLHISKAVYEDRKEKYTTRIQAMLQYVNDNTACRSRYLLRYFGEKNLHNCQQCDVCLSKHSSKLKTGEFNSKQELILQALNKQSFSIQDLIEQLHPNTEIEKEHFLTVLEYLIDAKELIMDNDKIKINELHSQRELQ